MTVERSKEGMRIRTQQEQPENSCRPSVDVLFRSVADEYQGDALAVIMTGMGQDGLRGCGRIRERGGQILAQDEATSVVWECPDTSPMPAWPMQSCRWDSLLGRSFAGWPSGAFPQVALDCLISLIPGVPDECYAQ